MKRDLWSPVMLLLSVSLILAGRLPVQAQVQKLYSPVLAATAGGDLGITLVNPTLSDAQVTLTARDYSGAIIQASGVTNPAAWTLPASSQKARMATEIFGAGITGRMGWVEVSASTSAIKGFFVVFDSAATYIDGAELPSAPSNTLIFPKVSAAATSPTLLTLVNTSGQAVDASVSLYENSGRLAGSWHRLLPALAGLSGAISEWVPSGTAFEGYVVVESGTAAA